MSFNGGNQNTGFSFGQQTPTPVTSTMTSSSGLFSNGGIGGQPPASTQQQSSGFSFGSGGLFGSQTSSATVGQSQPSAFSGGSSAFSGGSSAFSGGTSALSGGTSAFGGGTPSSFGFGRVQTTSTAVASTTGYSLGAGATAAPTSLPQQKPPGFSFSTTGGFGGQTASGGASGFPFSQTPGSANSTGFKSPAVNLNGDADLEVSILSDVVSTLGVSLHDKSCSPQSKKVTKVVSFDDLKRDVLQAKLEKMKDQKTMREREMQMKEEEHEIKMRYYKLRLCQLQE